MHTLSTPRVKKKYNNILLSMAITALLISGLFVIASVFARNWGFLLGIPVILGPVLIRVFLISTRYIEELKLRDEW